MQTTESQTLSRPKLSQSLLSGDKIGQLVQGLEDGKIYIFMDFDTYGDLYRSMELTGKQIKQGIRGLVSHITHSYKILEKQNFSQIALDVGHSVPDSVYRILH